MNTDNHIYNNKDAGLALLESFGAEIYDNRIEDCKYGIRLSLGSADNEIYDNTFDSISTCEYSIGYGFLWSDETLMAKFLLDFSGRQRIYILRFGDR